MEIINPGYEQHYGIDTVVGELYSATNNLKHMKCQVEKVALLQTTGMVCNPIKSRSGLP